MSLIYICPRRAVWEPKVGETVYYASDDKTNPKVIEYVVVGPVNGNPGDCDYFVRHKDSAPNIIHCGSHFRSVLFQTPQEALLWRKHVLLRQIEAIDYAILEATRIYYEQSFTGQRHPHPCY